MITPTLSSLVLLLRGVDEPPSKEAIKEGIFVKVEIVPLLLLFLIPYAYPRCVYQ
jgi:hypothetical protein